MAFWGVLLIAVGLSALLDINIWPLVLIVVGIAILRPVLSGEGRYRDRDNLWWCSWDTSAWEGSHERRGPGPGDVPQRSPRV